MKEFKTRLRISFFPDDETPKKLTFQIKQPPEKSISASVDELKDAFKEVNIYVTDDSN